MAILGGIEYNCSVFQEKQKNIVVPLRNEQVEQ